MMHMCARETLATFMDDVHSRSAEEDRYRRRCMDTFNEVMNTIIFDILHVIAELLQLCHQKTMNIFNEIHC
jgi:hypothetical protein